MTLSRIHRSPCELWLQNNYLTIKYPAFQQIYILKHIKYTHLEASLNTFTGKNCRMPLSKRKKKEKHSKKIFFSRSHSFLLVSPYKLIHTKLACIHPTPNQQFIDNTRVRKSILHGYSEQTRSKRDAVSSKKYPCACGGAV